jgi:membrane fusion protein, multidrug efflux system
VRFSRLRTMAAAIALLTGIAGRPAEAQRPGGKPDANELIPVRVMRVGSHDLEVALEYVGDIRGEDEATVYSKVPGKIAEKTREDGAEVRKGDVIATVDRDEVGFKYEKAPVESPLSGVVGRTYVDRGTSVTPQTPVALVVNLDSVKIRLDIPEKYIARIAVDQPAQVRVDAYPEAFTGRVTRISPVVDVATRTAPIEIRVPNPGHRLKPGMFARARLVMEQRMNAQVVLREAVLGRAPGQHVYVVADGVAKEQPVKLGLYQGGEYEVLEGLSQGDLVVIMGQQRLRNGSKVLVEEDPR